MSELLPEDAWSGEFQTANTRTLLAALQRRLQSSTTHVHALAELFHERAAIEQEYSARLAKLARAAETGQLLGKNGTEWERDGGEAKLWKTVLNDVQETSSAHSTLAAMIRADFEQPIRDIPSKIVPWRRIHDQEAGLDRALKEHDKVTVKLDKAKAKSKKAGDLQAELAQLDETITSLTPMTFATFQRLDESRLRSLKEVIVRWATARADMAARDGERSEQSAAKILSWEPQDEVVALGHRLASAAGARPNSQQVAVTTPPASNTPTRRMSVQTAGSTDFTPRVTKANGSTSNVATATVASAGGFGGFKSLLSRKATVGGRQRSGSEATSVRSGRRPTAETIETVEEGRSERQMTTPIRERPELRRDRESSQNVGSPAPSHKAPPVDNDGFSIAPPDRHRNPWDEPEDAEKSRDTAPAPLGATPVALPSAIMAEQRSSSPAKDSADSSSAASMRDAPPRLNLALSSKPIQESEEERNAALAKMQQTLSLTPQAPSRRSTIARGRREARHTFQASSAEGGPLPAAHVAALAKMGEEERLAEETSPTLSPGATDIPRRRSVSSLSSRNPFESPGIGASNPTLVGPSNDTGTTHGSAAMGAAAGGAAALGAGAAVLTTRTTSNGSAQRLNSAGSPPEAGAFSDPAEVNASNDVGQQHMVVSPEQMSQPGSTGALANPAPTSPESTTVPITSPTSSAHGSAKGTIRPGLCATIVETVHVLMRKNQAQSIVITGDVSLSLAASPTSSLPPAGSAIHIRLTDFDALESIAPNPTFLAQVPDSPGEYYLNTDMVAQATSAQLADQSQPATGPLLFQYQVLVEPGSETSIAPLALNPAFQIKEGETRMILHYRAAANANVSNLNLSVSFPTKPKDTQSKPVTGSWSQSMTGSDDQVVTWRPAVQAGQDGKIIARFVNPGRLIPQTISAHFVCPGRLLSGIGIETVDDPQATSGWVFTNVDRSVVSGDYIGEANINP